MCWRCPKIEAGKMTPVMTSFDLHSFLGDLEEMIRLRAEQKGLTLFFERRSDLPQYIETDVRKLRQILVNLLGNGVKYTEKGRITLRIAFREGMGGRPLKPSLHLQPGLNLKSRTPESASPRRIGNGYSSPLNNWSRGRTTRDGTGLGLSLSRHVCRAAGR